MTSLDTVPYASGAPVSADLFARAQRITPGGVNSPVRAFRGVGGTPRFMVEGSGPTGPSVQVTWNVVFEDDAVLDDYKQYLRIEDDAGFSTGFDEVGSWSVTP